MVFFKILRQIILFFEKDGKISYFDIEKEGKILDFDIEKEGEIYYNVSGDDINVMEKTSK